MHVPELEVAKHEFASSLNQPIKTTPTQVGLLTKGQVMTKGSNVSVGRVDCRSYKAARWSGGSCIGTGKREASPPSVDKGSWQGAAIDEIARSLRRCFRGSAKLPEQGCEVRRSEDERGETFAHHHKAGSEPVMGVPRGAGTYL